MTNTPIVRAFTHRFGISPPPLPRRRRIEAARRQLLDGLPVARVATDAGFHDQAHFTKHSKRHVGTTPGSYRERGAWLAERDSLGSSFAADSSSRRERWT